MTQNNSLIDSSSNLVVQISDTHLCADPNRNLRGINTQDCLKAVLGEASKHLQQASIIIATGDISHDGSSESYIFLKDQLNNQNALKSFLPGNHDKLETFSHVTHQPHWPSINQVGEWLIIGLDSHISEKSAGHLGTEQLTNLESILAKNANQPILIALHHPPISTGSLWIDEISLINQIQFRQLLNKYSQVQAVIFGHAHQEMDETYKGIRYLCCPSTCVQFLPNTESAYSDTRLPGYRWIKLYQDGKLDTGVKRISEWPINNGPDRYKWV